MTIRVILAEDNYLVREGIKQLIESRSELQLVATCDDYDSLISAVETHASDVVLTDIRMPPSGTDEGIKAAEHTRDRLIEKG